jgi:hypothetical protein
LLSLGVFCFIANGIHSIILEDPNGNFVLGQATRELAICGGGSILLILTKVFFIAMVLICFA